MPISVFLSHPQPITDAQKAFLARLSDWLSARGFWARTLGVTDYSDDVPLYAIRGLMAECNGLISVALRRTHITAGTRHVRAGQKYRPEAIQDEWLTSPWSQIEPAMAYQVGLPVLILKEEGVLAEGVLEKGIVGLYLPEFDTMDVDPAHYLTSPEWEAIGNKWMQKVRNVVATKAAPPKLY